MLENGCLFHWNKPINNKKEEFDLLVISKHYWFIQRLVQKDKISHFEIDRKIINSWWLYHWKETTINRVWNNLDKVLIVLLAISENPISDLISYLK
jgi:hypothetical protein